MGLVQLRESCQEMVGAYQDYKNKMHKLANIHEGEAYFLKKLAESCGEVSEECQEVADYLKPADIDRHLPANQGIEWL